MLHGHGDDGYRHPGAVRVNFSSNVMPGGCPPGLTEHLQSRLATIDTYPEAAAETLTALIADHEGVAPEHVLVTNGATAAIHLVAQAFRARHACVITPTFAEYEDACAANDCPLSFLPWKDFAAGAEPPGDWVWLCNPNNPTGAVLPRERLQARIRSRPETLFVIDLAYAELCAEPPLTAGDCLACPNLLLIKSLTKRFAIPGLRLGYLVAAAELRQKVRRFSAPWSVNSLALAAGEFLLKTKPAARPLAVYLAEAREFQRWLAAINGVVVEPSSTGYFLFRLGRGSGAELKTYLLREHGFLVRDAGNFRGLDAGCVRVATRRPEQNRALVAAIEQWMRSS